VLCDVREAQKVTADRAERDLAVRAREAGPPRRVEVLLAEDIVVQHSTQTEGLALLPAQPDAGPVELVDGLVQRQRDPARAPRRVAA